MELYYHFGTGANPSLKEVGGKALSLIRMTGAGFPVPPGVVLTSRFFEPWFEEIKALPAWGELVRGGEIPRVCQKIKGTCGQLTFTPGQEEALARGMKELEGESALWAVRSSSPEEDLEGASFAGGYETTLGVRREELPRAVRHSFASCFDERVFLYKKERGFDILRPGIGVVIQAQVASEVSGVAFTLNPLNNCYDEGVINANRGLGETVVSGDVTPDQFILDKITGEVLSRKTGAKEKALFLKEEGGVEERGGAFLEPCLTEEDLRRLLDLMIRVEEQYNQPMDLEWAISRGQLYLLQARPVTAYVPLPPEMITSPGAPRRLYLDHLLSKQGVTEPFSVLGLSCLESMQVEFFADLTGVRNFLGVDGLHLNYGGRGYIEVENSIKAMGKKRLIWGLGTQDTIARKILENLDGKEYKAGKLKKELRFLALKSVFKSMGLVKGVFKALKDPEGQSRSFEEEREKFFLRLKEWDSADLPPLELYEKITLEFVRWMDTQSLCLTYAAETARNNIKKIFQKEPREVRDKEVFLEQALPRNVTIEMGLALYDLALSPELENCGTGEEFAGKIKARSFSPAFMKAYDQFMLIYGHRCPRELDLASPRFYDTPAEVFRQLKELSRNRDSHNPREVYRRGLEKREESFKELEKIAAGKGKGVLKKFHQNYNILVHLGAYREIHKYYFILVLTIARRGFLRLGQEWVRQGRLKRKEDLFHLTREDLRRAQEDDSLDLYKLIEENTAFVKKLKNFPGFPRIIDSRGKILRPPRKAVREGEVAGEPISPGVCKGRIKVLSRPDEKPILPGEILVARATDPGWTPLFLNAGGIILEVGGLLQHGALVAREYCKPCVAGIEGVTGLFRDGQEVEVDGTTGVIRLVTTT